VSNRLNSRVTGIALRALGTADSPPAKGGAPILTSAPCKMIVFDHPLLVFACSFLALWLATLAGATVLTRWHHLKPAIRSDFGTILVTTLTLNGLIIGFTFSMAIGRYEQRKNYEEAEANAIGTEYVRADLMTAPDDAAKVRALLQEYVHQRVLYYLADDDNEIRQNTSRTSALQRQLWTAVRNSAATQPTVISALTVAGMNDVLNSQGYTQASWWNRIPTSAWILMAAIAVISHVLVGYGTRNAKSEHLLLMVLPLVVSISFLLIADIDSPRSGIIRVIPQNLMSLSRSMEVR
jgi:hypothetical protein